MRILLIIILIFWVGCLVRTILNLTLVPRLKSGGKPPHSRVSVIIPARDEERTIERTVWAMLAQTYPALEIIVVNDRSTDGTEGILRGIEDPRLIVIHGEEPPAGWLGKPWALHQGSLRAGGELLLFVDADVIYEPEAIAAAVATMEKLEVPMLALLPDIVMRGFWEHVVMPNLSMFALAFLDIWLGNRTRWPILAVGGGTGNLVRRAEYDAAGGHEALKGAVIDDVGLARLFRKKGFRTATALADDFVSVRMYHGLREIVHGFTKNAFAVFGRAYSIGLLFMAMAAVFHLLPFALALTGNVLALATVALITLCRLILFIRLRYRIDNALFAHPLMIAAWCWILARSMWITGIRRQVHWRGRTYDAKHTRFGD